MTEGIPDADVSLDLIGKEAAVNRGSNLVLETVLALRELGMKLAGKDMLITFLLVAISQKEVGKEAARS